MPICQITYYSKKLQTKVNISQIFEEEDETRVENCFKALGLYFEYYTKNILIKN